MGNALATIPAGGLSVEKAREWLTKATKVDEVKQIRDKATALLAYARARKAADEDVKLAHEVLLWCDRRLGELTREMPKAPPESRGQGRSGQSGNKPLPDSPLKSDALAAAGITKMQASRAEKLAAMPEAEFRAAVTARAERGKAAAEKAVHVSHNTGEQQWYTPPAILNVARVAMGGIDLDPASCAKANETVQAKRFYSRKDDGLAQPWAGRVWLNPPYASGVVDAFAQKAVDSAPDVEAMCVLVNNATDTAWCQLLLTVASAVCLIAGRVKFLDKTGKATGAPLQGQILIFCGSHAATGDFIQMATAIGTCCKVCG